MRRARCVDLRAAAPRRRRRGSVALPCAGSACTSPGDLERCCSPLRRLGRRAPWWRGTALAALVGWLAAAAAVAASATLHRRVGPTSASVGPVDDARSARCRPAWSRADPMTGRGHRATYVHFRRDACWRSPAGRRLPAARAGARDRRRRAGLASGWARRCGRGRPRPRRRRRPGRGPIARRRARGARRPGAAAARRRPRARGHPASRWPTGRSGPRALVPALVDGDDAGLPERRRPTSARPA